MHTLQKLTFKISSTSLRALLMLVLALSPLLPIHPFTATAAAQPHSYDYTYTFGATGFDNANATATDTSGNVFVAGRFNGTVNFDPTGGTDNKTSNGNDDAFLTKINADGSYDYTYTFGGTSTDEATALATDSSGNVFVAGYFRNTVNFDPTGGTDNKTSNGGDDIFLTKINADGSYDYTYTFGGTSFDEATALATDSSGNVFVAGEFQSTVNFDPTGGTDNKTSNGGNDAFLTKINANGSYGYTYTFGGTSSDGASALATDSFDNLYVGGFFQNTVNFDPTGGTDNKTSNGDDDAFLTKINADGSYGYTYTFGGTGSDRASALATDSSGNVFVAGRFRNTVNFDPTGGTDNKMSNGSDDAFLTKINANGSYGYTYTFGGTGFDVALALATDSSGNVFVAGYFQNTVNFDPTGGTDNKTSNGGADAFLTKINANGSYDYTYTFGGTGNDFASALATDSSGNVYVAGYFQNTVNFDPTGGTDNKTSNGSFDAFLTKFNAPPPPAGFLPGNRRVTMSTSAVSAVASYDVEFTAGGSYDLRTIIVDFCGNSPIVGDVCSAPTGFNAGSPPVVSGISINAVDDTANWTSQTLQAGRGLQYVRSTVTPVVPGDTVNFEITGVVNPSTLGTFFGRILTYSLDIVGYDGDIPGPTQDAGGVALSTAAVITVTSKVQERLTFCTYTTGTGDTCLGASGTDVILGDTNGVLDPSGAYVDKNTRYSLTTNALGGVVVRVKGSTLTSGGFSIDAIGGGTIPAVSSAGTEQFGFCTYPSHGTGLSIDTDYQGGAGTECASTTQTAGTATPGGAGAATFSFITSELNSTYGDTIATKTAGEYSTGTLAFLGNISNTTEAGIYTTTLTFVATGMY